MPTSPASPCPACRQLTYKPPAGCTRCGYTRRRTYGSRHRTLAAQLRVAYPTGPCWRCGLRGAWDDPADPLEEGHIDPDGPTAAANVAPEHRSCNRRGARRG